MLQCLQRSSGALECEESSARNHWNTKDVEMLPQNQSSWQTGNNQGQTSGPVPNHALGGDNIGCLSPPIFKLLPTFSRDDDKLLQIFF